MPDVHPHAETPGPADAPAEHDVALGDPLLLGDDESGTREDAIVLTDAVGPSRRAKKVKKKKTFGVVFYISCLWLAGVVLSAVLAPWLPLADPNKSILTAEQNAAPSIHHFFGTDANLRDIFSRCIWGGRITLVVGFLSIVFGLFFGGLIGVIAGYYRGRVEAVLMAITDISLSFPQLIFLIAVVTFIGRSSLSITFGIGVLSIAPLARIVRGSTLAFSQREFVTAARALGAKNSRIIIREILPNIVPAAISFGIISVGVAIVAEGALSFLGLSVNGSTPSWGNLINTGRSVIDTSPHVSLAPAMVLFLTVLSLNFLGDSLRARFDIREGAL